MFIINEFQTSGNTTAIVTPAKDASWDNAQSVFHNRCASAAISQVPIHTVNIMDERGVVYENKVFLHGVEE